MAETESFDGSGEKGTAARQAWFEELLRLDPYSTSFYPYARFLCDAGKYEQAVAVLRKGLEHAPDFWDARLLLIELGGILGDSGMAAREAAYVASRFRSSKSFWDAWAEQEGSPDAAAAVRLAGLILRGGISVADVITAGVRSLSKSEDAFHTEKIPAETASVSGQCTDGSVAEGSAGIISSDRSEKAPADSIPEHLGEGAVAADPQAIEKGRTDKSLSFVRLSTPGFFSNPSSSAGNLGSGKTSIRTRTMADILAEQGDVRGALEIYDELLGKASAQESALLRKKAESLRKKLISENQPQKKMDAVEFLNKLAVRLEKKALL